MRAAALALAAALLVTPGGPGRAAAEPTRQEAREALRALAVNPNLSSVVDTVEMLKRRLIQRRKDTI